MMVAMVVVAMVVQERPTLACSCVNSCVNSVSRSELRRLRSCSCTSESCWETAILEEGGLWKQK